MNWRLASVGLGSYVIAFLLSLFKANLADSKSLLDFVVAMAVVVLALAAVVITIPALFRKNGPESSLNATLYPVSIFLSLVVVILIPLFWVQSGKISQPSQLTTRSLTLGSSAPAMTLLRLYWEKFSQGKAWNLAKAQPQTP